MSQDYLEIAKYDALIVPHSNNPDELNLLWIYNYCDEDPIIMKNSLRAIYPFNEFAVYIHSDKKKELSNQIKGFMRKHGLLKDQRFSSFITFLYIFSINDFDFSDISKVFRVSDTIKKQFEMIDDPILATEQKVSIETRLKKWIAIESYLNKARLGKWRLFKIIAANFSEHLDLIKPYESIAPSIILEILKGSNHELIRDKANPMKTVSDIIYQARHPKAKYTNYHPSINDFEQVKYDLLGFTAF